MRPIKFRAWNKENERILDNVELGKCQLNYLTFASHLTLMQFTGLLDKNGTELYEKDLCRDSKGDIIEIGMVTPYVDYINHPLGLIGNVYENNER